MVEISKPDDNITRPEKSSAPTKPVHEGFQTRQDLGIIQKLENGISLPKQFQTHTLDSATSVPDSDQTEGSRSQSRQQPTVGKTGRADDTAHATTNNRLPGEVTNSNTILDSLSPEQRAQYYRPFIDALNRPDQTSSSLFKDNNSDPMMLKELNRDDINNVDQEKEKLMNRLETTTSPKERKIFQDFIAAFEARAKKDKLPEQEIAQTFRALNSLLGLGTPEAVRLGLYAMAHVSYPTSINIGFHDACPLGFNESRITTLHPSIYLSVLAGVAGPDHQFRTQSGNIVRIDANSLREENWPLADRSLRRDIASQYFQVAAANVHWQGRNARWGNGDIQYQTNHKLEFEGDTGDRLIDRGVNPPQVETAGGKPIYNSVISNNGMVDIYQQLVGNVPEVLSITNYNDPFAHLVPAAERTAGIVDVRTEQELRQVLDKLAHGTGENRFPVAAVVHTSNEPWLTDSGANREGAAGRHGWHTVAVTGYNSETGEVFVDNWWSAQRDHLGRTGTLPPMTVTALHASMHRNE